MGTFMPVYGAAITTILGSGRNPSSCNSPLPITAEYGPLGPFNVVCRGNCVHVNRAGPTYVWDRPCPVRLHSAVASKGNDGLFNQGCSLAK